MCSQQKMGDSSDDQNGKTKLGLTEDELDDQLNARYAREFSARIIAADKATRFHRNITLLAEPLINFKNDPEVISFIANEACSAIFFELELDGLELPRLIQARSAYQNRFIDLQYIESLSSLQKIEQAILGKRVRQANELIKKLSPEGISPPYTL